MKHKTSAILTHPISIALFAGAVSFLILSFWINEYKGDILQKRTFDKKYNIYYENLFNDSTNEKIIAKNYSPLKNGLIQILNPVNNQFLGIWNLEEQSVKRAPVLFGDYDNNKKSEIWVFTRKKDSIFYYLIDPRKDGRFIRKRRFITKTQLIKGGKVDLEIRSVGEQDLNNDGFDEMYFAVDAGFSMTPRRIFAVDVINEKVYKSPKAGVRFNSGIIMHDIAETPGKEIILKIHASDNYPDSSKFPYNDNSSWLLVLNKKLEFLFKPIEFEGAPSYVHPNLYIHDKNINIAAKVINRAKNNHKALLVLFNASGEKIREINLNQLPIGNSSVFVRMYNRQDWDKIVLSDISGSVYFFDHKLKLTHKKNLPVNRTGFHHYKDIDKSLPGQEIVIPTNSGFLITGNNYNILTKVETMTDCLGLYTISIVKRNKKKTILSFCSSKKWYKVSYEINPLYQNRWALSIVMFILVLMIIHIRNLRLKKQKAKLIHKKIRLQEAEKKRLAKELHDELGSKLTGLRLQIENIKDSDNKQPLNEITDYIQNTHKEIRNIIHNLTPPQFKNYNFIGIVNNLVNEYNKYSNISIKFDVSPDGNWNGELSEHVKFHTYRIIQEAITNIIKHSDADQALIQLNKNKNRLKIYIEDNGKGFDEKANEKGGEGLGLQNMELRTTLLNGELDIRTDSNGTIIEINIPK